MTALYNALESLGYDRRGIDDSIPNKPRSITHNQINYCLRQIYKNIFQPDKALYNNQASKIDYNDCNQLYIIAQSFLDICMMFNKSLGLMSFCYLTGINPDTIYRWISPEGKRLNPERSEIIKYIQEGHKAAQIALLNDSPVGALAVANNDVETGLEWSRHQALTAASNTVFLLSSERAEKLKLTAPATAETATE